MTTWAESGLPEEDKFKENIEPWRLCYFRTVVDIMTAELNEIEEKKQPQDLSYYDWIRDKSCIMTVFAPNAE